MQQHDGKHPHYFRTAVLRLLQQKLLAATGQVYLHQRDNVGNQYQIKHLDIYRRLDLRIYPLERNHKHRVYLAGNGNDNSQQKEILHPDKKSQNRFRHLNQMIRVHRKNQTGNRSCHYTRQQRSNGCLRSIETFDGFDNNQ